MRRLEVWERHERLVVVVVPGSAVAAGLQCSAVAVNGILHACRAAARLWQHSAFSMQTRGWHPIACVPACTHTHFATQHLVLAERMQPCKATTHWAHSCHVTHA